MKKSLLWLVLLSSLCLVSVTGCGKIFGGGASGAIKKAARREEVKANIVGKFLKEKSGGKKTVIVCSFGTKETTLGKAFLEAFKKSYGDATVVELKEYTDDVTGDGIPLADVEEALKEHEDAELIVFYGSTVPVKYQELKNKAVYFFFEQGAGSSLQIRRDIDSGKIIGIVMGQPRPPKAKEPIEKDDKEAFDKRYIIIDRDNIGANADFFME